MKRKKLRICIPMDTLMQLFEIVKSLAQTIANLSCKVDSLVNSQQSPQTPSQNPPISRESLFIEFHEFEERKKRKDSIIVRGITASNNEEFKTVFTGVSRELVGRVITLTDVHCISQQRKMYRVRIGIKNDRAEILENSKRLKDNPNYKNVFISRDLTYSQRQAILARRNATSLQNSTSSTSLLVGASNSASPPSGESSSNL